MQVMNEERRLKWLKENITGRVEWPARGRTYTGLAREVPNIIACEFDRRICELPPELMFMHEAIFPHGTVVEDIELKYEAPQMFDACTEVDLEELKYRTIRKLDNRVDDYLNNSVVEGA